jgi:hypothetical protein
VIRYRNESIPLARQIFVCTFVLGGRSTEVGPGDDLVDVEGSVIATIVVVWVDMDDLIPCLSQTTWRNENREEI